MAEPFVIKVDTLPDKSEYIKISTIRYKATMLFYPEHMTYYSTTWFARHFAGCVQGWYDKYILEIDNIEDRPKCEHCGKAMNFYNAIIGYKRHGICSISSGEPVMSMSTQHKYIKGYRSSIKYWIPELNKWVAANHLARELAKIDNTIQKYYDKHLHLSNSKCVICGAPTEFKSISAGYLKCCANKDCQSKHNSNCTANAFQNELTVAKHHNSLIVAQNKEETRNKRKYGLAKFWSSDAGKLAGQAISIRLIESHANGKFANKNLNGYGNGHYMEINTDLNYSKNLRYNSETATTWMYVASNFEDLAVKHIELLGYKYAREHIRIKYDFDSKIRTYSIDFIIKTNAGNILVEIKQN